jgi:hypothetical protein
MEHWMYSGGNWKCQFVGNWTNTFDDMIGAIKFGCQLVVAMGFEGGLLVRLELEKHMITFLENLFRMLLVSLLLHTILGHVEVILQSREGSFSTLQQLVNSLDL